MGWGGVEREVKGGWGCGCGWDEEGSERRVGVCGCG